MTDRVFVNASFEPVAQSDPSVAWEFDADDPRVAHLQKKAKAAPEPETAEEAPKPRKK